MTAITRKYPGRTDAEIYARVDEVMGGVARHHALDYRKDAAARTGSVSKMGASGKYEVKDGQVTVELSYPFLVPGPLRRRIEDDIRQELDALFR